MTYSVRIVNYEKPESSEPSSEPAAPDLIGKQITVAENAFMPEIEAGQTKTSPSRWKRPGLCATRR